MQKIKIRLPATLTHFSPALDTLALAIGLYTHIELSPIPDNELIIESNDDIKSLYTDIEQHPVVKGITHFYHSLNKPRTGIHIKVDVDIPLQCGLGAENAMMIGGIIGANNLEGNPYRREELIDLFAQYASHRDGAIASFTGGLTSSIQTSDMTILHQSLPLTPFHLILAIPELERFEVNDSPELIAMTDVRHNIRATTLLLQALAKADMRLLGESLNDRIDQLVIQKGNPHFTTIAETAKEAGATAITTTGRSSAMVIFAREPLSDVVNAIQKRFEQLGTNASVMTVPVDTQGVVISMMQSA